MIKFLLNDITCATNTFCVYFCFSFHNYSKTNSSNFFAVPATTRFRMRLLFTRYVAVQGGTHRKNPKSSKECTYGVLKSGRNPINRNLYIVVWVVWVYLVGVFNANSCSKSHRRVIWIPPPTPFLHKKWTLLWVLSHPHVLIVLGSIAPPPHISDPGVECPPLLSRYLSLCL